MDEGFNALREQTHATMFEHYTHPVVIRAYKCDFIQVGCSVDNDILEKQFHIFEIP